MKFSKIAAMHPSHAEFSHHLQGTHEPPLTQTPHPKINKSYISFKAIDSFLVAPNVTRRQWAMYPGQQFGQGAVGARENDRCVSLVWLWLLQL